MLEIERIFLVDLKKAKEIARTCSCKQFKVLQAYPVIEDGRSEMRIRMRERVDAVEKMRYTITSKSFGSKKRSEVKTVITKEKFEEILPQAGERKFIKNIFEIPLAATENPHTRAAVAYLSFYKSPKESAKDVLDGLILVEVEFETEELADFFTPPSWFGKEVTDDYHYRGWYLSKIVEKS